jgi:hypothetical protein
MDVPEIRRRVRAAIEGARKAGQERRVRSDQASRDYEAFLNGRAVPAFRAFAAALAGEGFRFNVFTPAGSVRLASEHAADDYIELALDTAADPPLVIGRSSRGRGRRNLSSERAVKNGAAIADLTEDDVLEFLVSEIPPLVER